MHTGTDFGSSITPVCVVRFPAKFKKFCFNAEVMENMAEIDLSREMSGGSNHVTWNEA